MKLDREQKYMKGDPFWHPAAVSFSQINWLKYILNILRNSNALIETNKIIENTY